MTIQDELPAFDTITLGASARCRPDINSRLLHGFLLQIAGTGSPTAAEYIENIRVKVNNKEQLYLEPTPQALYDAFLNSNSDTLDTTFVHIPLTRPGHLFSPWGTRDIQSLDILCKLASTNPSGKTLTGLRGWMAYTPQDVPSNRGDVFLQTVIDSGTPVAGWNTVALGDLPVGDISFLTRLLLASTEVSEVEVKIGERTVFHLTDAAAYEAIARNPMYKLPSSPAVFPVFMDMLGLASDFPPLVENGVKRPVSLKYFHASQNYNAFKILIEGVQKANPAAVATAKA